MTAVLGSQVDDRVGDDPGGRARDRRRDPGRGSARTRPRRPLSTTGPLLLLMATGLLLHAVAGVMGRAGVDEGRVDDLFWVSLGLVVVPAAVRAAWPAVPRSERLALVLAAGAAMQLSRTALYPDHFVYHDEIAHSATLDHIRETLHLFTPTPTLPVSAYYPGLELATSAVMDLTGLDARAAAVVVLLAARLVLTVCLFLLVERLSGSSRTAALASALYLCNPQYLYFNSQFSYQTLALPLAVLVVERLHAALQVRRADQDAAARGNGPSRAQARRRLAVRLILPLAAVTAVTVVHHLTAMLLVGLLALWALADLLLARWVRGHRAREAGLVAGVAVVAGAAVIGWLLLPGNPVTDYLSEIARNAAAQLEQLTSGSSERNGLFADGQGDRAPLWLAVVATGSLVFTCLLLLGAFLAGRTWLRRGQPLAVVLVLVAAMYPLIPAGHLTSATSEVFDRSSGFVYIGLSFTVAWWLVQGRRRRWVASAVRSRVVVVLSIALLFLGGVSFGSGPRWNRLPGPYLVQADPRSVDAENLAVAAWEAQELPHDSRVLADRMNRLLAGSDGEMYPVTQLADRINPSSLLLAPRFTQEDVDALRAARLDYVVVDLRQSRTLPRVGIYWENGEWGQPHQVPVSPQALSKLESVPGVQRIYDSGYVQVYDVRRVDLATTVAELQAGTLGQVTAGASTAAGGGVTSASPGSDETATQTAPAAGGSGG